MAPIKETSNYKILLLGVGQIGSNLLQLNWPSNFLISPFSHKDLDITNQEKLEQTIQSHKWDFVINATGFVKVDQAERSGREPYLVNSLAVLHLSLLCQKYDIPLIHYSTDYIFDGMKGEAYREEDIPNPLNTYGLSKLFGETAIQLYAKKHIILRTSWVFGPYGHNFVKTILQKAQEEEKIYVVNDQVGTPTFSEDLAEATKEIILYHLQSPAAPKWGLYHYAGEGATSWYNYAKFILDTYWGKEKTRQILIPFTTEEQRKENPLITVRPLFSALNSNHIRETFSIISKDWKKGVEKTINMLRVVYPS